MTDGYVENVCVKPNECEGHRERARRQKEESIVRRVVLYICKYDPEMSHGERRKGYFLQHLFIRKDSG